MMVASADAHPLRWPEGVARTRPGNRQRARFKVPGFGRVRDELLAELRRLGAQHVVISTDIPLRHDGLPYANRREPDDPGVAVYFMLDGEQRAMACDRWDRVKDNARALTLTITALRGIARWGSSEAVERAFRGFAALPASGEHDWRSVLGVSEGTDGLDEVRRRYRKLAARAHPDLGGSQHEMARLNQAMAAAEKELAGA